MPGRSDVQKAPWFLAAVAVRPLPAAARAVVFSGPRGYATGSDPVSVAIADLNHDGFPDLVIVNSSSSDVSVLLGDGRGSFGPATRYPVGGAYPFSVAVGDLNGDGFPDLAVANSYSDSVSILSGDGRGGFAPPGALAVGARPYGVAMADLNSDGRADL